MVLGLSAPSPEGLTRSCGESGSVPDVCAAAIAAYRRVKLNLEGYLPFRGSFSREGMGLPVSSACFQPFGGGQGTPHCASVALVHPPSGVLAESICALVSFNGCM